MSKLCTPYLFDPDLSHVRISTIAKQYSGYIQWHEIDDARDYLYSSASMTVPRYQYTRYFPRRPCPPWSHVQLHLFCLINPNGRALESRSEEYGGACRPRGAEARGGTARDETPSSSPSRRSRRWGGGGRAELLLLHKTASKVFTTTLLVKKRSL